MRNAERSAHSVISIQRRLVLWMTAALVLALAVVLAATYLSAYRQISQVFDEELKRIALAVHLREGGAQEPTLRIARPGFNLSVRAYDRSGNVIFATVLPTMPPEAPKLYAEGFAMLPTSEGDWRVYTHLSARGVVQVGQPAAVRAALARRLSFRMALPELLLSPLLVLLALWVLKRGLGPLAQVSRLVQNRDAKRLQPLPTADVPPELLPLIEEINALMVRLARSMDEQRRFVADAAHELRSPIAALALQAQVAQRSQTPEARAAAYEELKRGIARATRLVEQLLRLASLGPDAPREPLRVLDLAQLARQVVGNFAARADDLGVDLGAEAPEPVLVRGAESELVSLVANLADNALRYAPRGSQVTVKVWCDSRTAALQVVDAGRGIPPQERSRVFERFQRVAGDGTHGIGLGLPIARAIVERHGGEISLEDAHAGRPMPGLAVLVTLPLHAPQPLSGPLPVDQGRGDGMKASLSAR
jgi:two-component system OmpR family sensor kinase